jgi:ArsR family transcriptional regulator, arsenate/arsenite/antimonite-responsive transcriptional repressor
MNPTLLDDRPETERTSKPTRLSSARRTAILKALADPRRFELLERIAKAGCPLGCAEARAALPISAATLSHHIKELETAGLINVRREGKFHFLTLKPGVLKGIIDLLAALDTGPCPTPNQPSSIAASLAK